MKRFISYILIIIALMQCMVFIPAAASNISYIIYVSDKRGSDNGNGTKEMPFKTIDAARQKAREIIPTMESNIIVEVEGGTYFQNETLRFDENDSGRNGHRVIYRGAENEKAVISGGRRVENWQNEGNGIWAADIDGVDEIHEFYLNGEKKQLARTETKILPKGYYIDENEPSVPKGLLFNKDLLDGIEYPEDMVCKWSSGWMCYILRCEGVTSVDPTQTALILQKDFQTLSVRETNPIRETAKLYIENAKRFMDEPGEFYYDKHTRKLYYIPKDGENMEDSDAIIPVLEKIVEISGTNAESKIENIDFKNLTFSHGAWNLPYQYGYNPVQAQWIYTADFEVAFTPSNIDVSFANDIGMYGNTFTGLACVGLSLGEMVVNSKIEGNAFYDIGDSAITVGKPTHDYIAEADEYQDVARNKSVKASSEFSRKYRGEQAVNPLTRELYWMPSNNDAKPNIVIDLGKEYNVRDVSLLFESGGVSYGEVMLSNDAMFRYPIAMKQSEVLSEKYKTSYAITEQNGTRYKYKLDSAAKVRYVKINVERFSRLCEVKVFDADTKGVATEGVCSNNKISNNYITRAADTYWSAPGITAYYTDNLEISSNHLEKLPYTGISVGWGWVYNTDSTTCYNNHIKNNFISEIMTECFDGGGVYTLGQQPGTRIEGNYIRKCRFPYGALYLDGGSAGIDVTNNVTEDTCAYFMNSPADGENNVYHNYATNPNTTVQNPSTNVSDTVLFPIGMPTAEIKRLMNNSGLKNEYRYLLDTVPKTPEDYKTFSKEGYINIVDMYGADGLKAYLLSPEIIAAETLLDNIKIGPNISEFSQANIDAFKVALQTARNAVSADLTPEQVYEEWINFRAAYDTFFETRNKVSHQSLFAKTENMLRMSLMKNRLFGHSKEQCDELTEFLASDINYVKNKDSYLHLEQEYRLFNEETDELLNYNDNTYLVNIAQGKNVQIVGSPTAGIVDQTKITNGTLTDYYEPNAAFEAVIDLENEEEIEILKIYTAKVNIDTDDYLEIYLSKDGVGYEKVLKWSDGVKRDALYQLYENDHGYIGFSLAGTGERYRYVKIVAKSEWKRICEIEVMTRRNVLELDMDYNISKGKTPYFISNTKSINGAAKLFNNDEFETTGVGEFWNGDVVLDLGGYYPIGAIGLSSRHDGYFNASQDYTVLLSQSLSFDDDKTVAVRNREDIDKFGTTIYGNPDKSKLYRYVKYRVNGEYATLNELKVFVEPFFEKQEKGNLAYKKPVFVTGGFKKEQTYNLTNADGGYTEYFINGFGGGDNVNYVQIDLGNTYDIGKVVVSLRKWIDNREDRENWEILLSNEVGFNDCQVYTLTDTINFGDDWIIDIPNTANYRYLRLVRNEDSYALLQEIAVYSKAESDHCVVDFNFSKIDENNVSVNSISLLPDYFIGNSEVIIGLYKGSRLVDVRTIKLSLSDEESLFSLKKMVFSLDKPIIVDKECTDIKSFVWDSTNQILPLKKVSNYDVLTLF